MSVTAPTVTAASGTSLKVPQGSPRRVRVYTVFDIVLALGIPAIVPAYNTSTSTKRKHSGTAEHTTTRIRGGFLDIDDSLGNPHSSRRTFLFS